MRMMIVVTVLLLTGACTREEPVPMEDEPGSAPIAISAPVQGGSDTRNAYFGDLHVHTMYSFDAFIFGTAVSPDDAYEYAKGKPVRHPGGFDMQLRVPFDFYAVTDHAYYLGIIRAMTDPTTAVSKHEAARGLADLSDTASRISKFQEILGYMSSDRSDDLRDEGIMRSAWEDIVAAADRHNDPGRFTTLVAYEYTSFSGEFENLHRNVIFQSDRVPALPFSRLDSVNPEDLWEWMDENRRKGIESLAIPHNSNGSNGQMFRLLDFNGNPLDREYADLRMRNEPLVEIAQIKGSSDTHPALSPNDEWADFEIMPYRIASTLPSAVHGSYVREALMNGIELDAKRGFNPFRFGIVGASDTHNGTWSGDEDDYRGKVGLVDDNPVERGSVPLPDSDPGQPRYAQTYFNTWGAAGIAGVWAGENTRESIYAAFRRKETFGTSGTRIKVRFFAGYDLPKPGDDHFLELAYSRGVPMGGDLILKSGEPSFLVWASRDVDSAPLQRLQVIKASVRNGKTSETVFDVACSDGLKVDPQTHRCPDNGAVVNLQDCSISADKGAGELQVLWQDPDFDEREHAMYYVRVLENPTCRWSTWDAIRSGVKPREDLQATIQERAWSSPIWLSPAADSQ